ncbi:2OG-Fe(II) oxygenase [Candidatus Pelagibacter sp.]|nr:2OG-Fe(II) oxygenase [Candidatus Pelagibacter sp.]
MKRISLIKEKTNNSGSSNEPKYPNFIGSWDIENDKLCKEIIDLFDGNKKLQKKGLSGSGMDTTIKKTTDITVTPNNLKDIKYKCLNNYINELYKCFKDYQEQWPFLKRSIKNVHIGLFNIQRYFPGDHFAKIHSERLNIQTLHRVFAWMTYLNDVDDGGTTNFSHYNIKIKPEIGKTLIWPAEWTHAHSGEILNSGVKYIVTGWMHFPYDN